MGGQTLSTTTTTIASQYCTDSVPVCSISPCWDLIVVQETLVLQCLCLTSLHQVARPLPSRRLKRSSPESRMFREHISSKKTGIFALITHSIWFLNLEIDCCTLSIIQKNFSATYANSTRRNMLSDILSSASKGKKAPPPFPEPSRARASANRFRSQMTQIFRRRS